MNKDDPVSLLAETNWRNNRKRFGIRQAAGIPDLL
jgi:hypothetical protein